MINYRTTQDRVARPQPKSREACSFLTFGLSLCLTTLAYSLTLLRRTDGKSTSCSHISSSCLSTPLSWGTQDWTVHIYLGDEGDVRCKTGLSIKVWKKQSSNSATTMVPPPSSICCQKQSNIEMPVIMLNTFWISELSVCWILLMVHYTWILWAKQLTLKWVHAPLPVPRLLCLIVQTINDFVAAAIFYYILTKF